MSFTLNNQLLARSLLESVVVKKNIIIKLTYLHSGLMPQLNGKKSTYACKKEERETICVI